MTLLRIAVSPHQVLTRVVARPRSGSETTKRAGRKGLWLEQDNCEHENNYREITCNLNIGQRGWGQPNADATVDFFTQGELERVKKGLICGRFIWMSGWHICWLKLNRIKV